MRPVGARRVVRSSVERSDLRLEPVRARRPSRRPGGREALEPFGDSSSVPPASVLLLQCLKLAGRVDARVSAGMLEQQQRLEAESLVVLRQQLRGEIGEVQRLFGEVVTEESVVGRRVALVEDEVDDGKHARRPLDEPVGLGHAEADAGVGDLGPRPQKPLTHRGLADQEGTRDLPGREPGDGLQRERHATRHRKRGVTACEEEAKPVVVVGPVSRRRGPRFLGQRFQLPQLVLLDPSSLEHVEGSTA